MWNYRMVERHYESPVMKDMKENISIEEVYYDKNGVPNGWTRDCNSLSGYDSKDSLEDNLMRIKNALNKPILKVFCSIDNTERLFTDK